MLRRSVLPVVLFVAVALTAVMAPSQASAATSCGSAVTRAHSTSTRSGSIWVRACGGAQNYGQFGVSTGTVWGLQTNYLYATVSTYSSSGTLLASRSCNIGGTSNLFIYEMCRPSYTTIAGRRYFSKIVLRYDVKDDGRGEYSLTSYSPTATA